MTLEKLVAWLTVNTANCTTHLIIKLIAASIIYEDRNNVRSYKNEWEMQFVFIITTLLTQ
jgi:hypothetical protein